MSRTNLDRNFFSTLINFRNEIIYKYRGCVRQTQQNFIMLIIVLGQYVSILIESSSDLSKKIDPYLKRLKRAVGSQTLTFLIKLCVKCMCRFALIVQSGYLILKLYPVHMKEVSRIHCC